MPLMLRAHRLLLAVVPLLLAGCKGSSGSSGAPGSSGWDGKSALMCGGHDVVHVTGKTANLVTGPVIIAGGDCELTIEDCTITAPEILSVGGSAKVVIKGGHFDATSTVMAPMTMANAGTDPTAMAQVAEQMAIKPGTALFSAGRGDLTVDGAEIRGNIAVRADGFGKILLKGGQVTGAAMAITSDGGAIVTVQGTKVTGTTKHASDSKIVGI
jgi:Contractile injection system spike tip protein